jgi:hypothetical protein
MLGEAASTEMFIHINTGPTNPAFARVLSQIITP